MLKRLFSKWRRVRLTNLGKPRVSIAKRDPVAPVLGQPVLLGDSLQPAVGHRQLHLNVVLPVLGLVVSPQRCQWPVHASFTYIAYNTIFRLLSFAFTDSHSQHEQCSTIVDSPFFSNALFRSPGILTKIFFNLILLPILKNTTRFRLAVDFFFVSTFVTWAINCKQLEHPWNR